MPDILQVGPIGLDFKVLIYIMSWVIGLFVIKLRLRKVSDSSKAIFDLMLSSVLIIALFWKFGSILFMPSIIWNKPLQLLMMTGTWKEIVLGAIVALIYTMMQLRKIGVPYLVFWDAIPFGILSAAILRNLLIWEYGLQTSLFWGISVTDPTIHYHPVNGYIVLCSSLLMIWLWRSKYELGSGKVIQDFLIYYGIGMWAISYLKNASGTWFILSEEQVIYIAMIVLGIGIQYIISKEK